jgi:hypothetical protein
MSQLLPRRSASRVERIPLGRLACCGGIAQIGRREIAYARGLAMFKSNPRRRYGLVLLLAMLPWSGASGAPADYPTATIADYVYGCLKANGETRTALDKCSCSIDVIASLLPYEHYSAAEAYLSLRHVTGERGVIFRTAEPARAAIDRLRRAQAEAEVRCF